MTSKSWSAGTIVDSPWLQDVDNAVYKAASGITGASTRSLLSKLSDIVSVKDFGAVGDGTTDDTTAVATAFAAVTAGSVLLFPSGKTYKIGNVNFSGKEITLLGYGATIACTSATGAIYKTDHGNKLRVLGLSFTGTGTSRAINLQQTPTATVYDEVEIDQCSFTMGSGVYGIYSIGSREIKVDRCTFYDSSGGSGIYFLQSVSPFVNKCIFKGTAYTARGVYYQGNGDGFCAGLILRDCEIMGYDKGLEVVGTQFLVVTGCTIDYCNNSVKLAAQNGANLSNNYFGSLAANAALWITYDAAPTSPPNYSAQIIIENNTIVGHYSAANTYDCILLDGATSPDATQIRNNNITFYTRYGINFNFSTSTRLAITGNTFAQLSGHGVAPIFNTSGANDGGVVVKDNYFSNATTLTAMNISASCTMLSGNLGCSTETHGQVTIGVGSFTVTFSHGLAYTPNTFDVLLTPVNQPAFVAGPYVSSTSSTQVVVNTNANVAGSTAGIGYRISRAA